MCQETFQISAPTPRNLVVSLMNAATFDEIGIGGLVRAGELYEIDAAAMRMAVGRLVKARVLEVRDRGLYAIGAEGRALQSRVRQWRTAEDRTAPWSGGWLLAATAHLGRSDRARLRQRERALFLYGFAEFVSGLWVRPDNLRESLRDISAGMKILGFDENVLLYRVSDAAAGASPDPQSLWPIGDLEAGYQARKADMDASTRRLDGASSAQIAKETLIIGETVIKTVNRDPLLPQAVIDVDARREMIDAMIDYDAMGVVAWSEILARG